MSNLHKSEKMNFGYKKLYINGDLVDSKSGKKLEVICPANEESIGSVAMASLEDAKLALKSAKQGFLYWSKLSLVKRTEWINKLKDAVILNENKLRSAITYEMGKPYAGSYEDFEALVNALDWYPNAMKNLKDEMIPDYENTHTHKLISQPAGVVVAYLAWNFPLLNVAFKLGPALAAGCSIVLKPSEVSPLSAYILGEILNEINFPSGVVNILTGKPDEVAVTLSQSKIPSVVTMIGSTATGKKVIADSASSIKKLSMELGGNAPFIVFDDADLVNAIDLAVAIKYGNSGQICVAANRFFIHENIYDEFVKGFKQKVTELSLGFGLEQSPDMGPLISKNAQSRMTHFVNDAVAKGATLLFGGSVPKSFESGYWFSPTILVDVTTEMAVFKEEIFGPIAPIMKFNSDEEVLKLANSTEYGLASYIFTSNANRIQFFSEQLEFGEVQINGIKYAIYLPHGGIKNSGIGHDCSHLALNDYLVQKRISSLI